MKSHYHKSKECKYNLKLMYKQKIYFFWGGGGGWYFKILKSKIFFHWWIESNEYWVYMKTRKFWGVSSLFARLAMDFKQSPPHPSASKNFTCNVYSNAIYFPLRAIFLTLISIIHVVKGFKFRMQRKCIYQ